MVRSGIRSKNFQMALGFELSSVQSRRLPRALNEGRSQAAMNVSLRPELQVAINRGRRGSSLMEPSLQKLLEIGGAPFVSKDAEFTVPVLDRFGSIGASLADVLRRKDGFFCFESALRVFPSVTTESSWSIGEWNSHDLWKADYRGLADVVLCFAEELFGRQFVIAGGEVGIFEVETGEVEIVACSLEEWASKILLDYNQMTGYGIAHKWQHKYGPLHARHRLMAKTPFVLGGDYSVSNLASTESHQMMKELGNLAYQIHDLPEGTRVELKVL